MIMKKSKVKNGLHKSYFKDGKPKAQGHYKNGKRHGPWEDRGGFYWSGREISGGSVRRGSYVNGKRDGLWEFYRDEKKGVLSKNGNYKHGKKHGIWDIWEISGVVLDKRCEYSNGRLKTVWQYQYGILRNKYSIKNGTKHGPSEAYDDKGNVHIRGCYKDGYHSGLWEWFNPSGEVSFKGPYTNNQKNGLWEFFDDNGKLYKTEFWTKDHLKKGNTKRFK